jgi:hypothetical protein
LRPGIELERLSWGAIDQRRVPNSRRTYWVLHVFRNQGKHEGEREAVAFYHPVVSFDYAIRELRDIHGGSPRLDALLFALPEQHSSRRRGRVRHVPQFDLPFRALLEKLGLRHVAGQAETRTLYSLRHFFANEQIERGIPVYDLKVVMGTSVLMLEKYYGKALSRRKQADMIGNEMMWRASLMAEQGLLQQNEPDNWHPSDEEPVEG